MQANKNCEGRFVVMALTIVAVSLPAIVQGQMPVKVHKNLIIVSPPDREGLIRVNGTDGAVESTGPITAQLHNLNKNIKIPIDLNEDGSFDGVIHASSGDSVRVVARNRQGRRSYGTFTVPTGISSNSKEQLQTSAIENQHKQLNRQSGLSSEQDVALKTGFHPDRTDSTRQETIGLAVIITVVNTNTGQIVAAERIAGDTRAKHHQTELFASVVKNILAKCKAVANAEFNRRNPALVNQQTPATGHTTPTDQAIPANQPIPSLKTDGNTTSAQTAINRQKKKDRPTKSEPMGPGVTK